LRCNYDQAEVDHEERTDLQTRAFFNLLAFNILRVCFMFTYFYIINLY